MEQKLSATFFPLIIIKITINYPPPPSNGRVVESNSTITLTTKRILETKLNILE